MANNKVHPTVVEGTEDPKDDVQEETEGKVEANFCLISILLIGYMDMKYFPYQFYVDHNFCHFSSFVGYILAPKMFKNTGSLFLKISIGTKKPIYVRKLALRLMMLLA